MTDTQAYLDTKQAVRDHESNCDFCQEPGCVNYFACPTSIPLGQIVSDSITQDQIDENTVIRVEIEAEAQRTKLEAPSRIYHRSLFSIIIPLGTTKRTMHRMRYPRSTFFTLSKTNHKKNSATRTKS